VISEVIYSLLVSQCLERKDQLVTLKELQSICDEHGIEICIRILPKKDGKIQTKKTEHVRINTKTFAERVNALEKKVGGFEDDDRECLKKEWRKVQDICSIYHIDRSTVNKAKKKLVTRKRGVTEVESLSWLCYQYKTDREELDEAVEKVSFE
jgi:uncharacterized membrane protein YfhO